MKYLFDYESGKIVQSVKFNANFEGLTSAEGQEYTNRQLSEIGESPVEALYNAKRRLEVSLDASIIRRDAADEQINAVRERLEVLANYLDYDGR